MCGIARLVGLGLAALVMAGCGGGDGGDATAPGTAGTSVQPGGEPPPARPRIALVMKSLANEFFKTMADGAQAHQQAHATDYELITNGIKDERDLARQVALMEEMIAQGVQAIVIAPADSKALVAVCKRAIDAGIVVVNIDNRLDAEVVKSQGVTIPFVGPDNREGARLVAETLRAKLPAGTPVGLLEGIRTAFNGQQRLLGFQDTAQAAGWKVVDSQSGQWEIDIANRIAAAMLSEHPEIQALLCCNDNMALGAMAAVKAAGKTGQVAIVGYDGISAIQQAIRAGAIAATADQHADQLAVFGIEYALQILKDRSTPADRTTPVDIVTAASLKAAP